MSEISASPEPANNMRELANKKRSKILGREIDRLGLLTGEVKPEGESIDRPIMARRRRVQSQKAKEEEKEEKVDNINPVSPVEEGTPVKKVDESNDNMQSSSKGTDVPLENKEEQTPSKADVSNENVNDESSAVAAEKKASLKMSQARKELEETIAQQTAEFDSNLASKPLKRSKNTNSESKIDVDTTSGQKQAAFQPAHLMKIVRIFTMVLISGFIGYRACNVNQRYLSHSRNIIMRVQQEKPIEWQTLSLFQEASNGEDSDRENLKKMINDMSSATSDESSGPAKELDYMTWNVLSSAFPEHTALTNDIPSGFFDYISSQKVSTTLALKDGTWNGWIKSYFLGQAERTLTAVGLLWWFAGFFKPLVNMLTPKNNATSPGEKSSGVSGIVGQLFSLYSNGIEVLYEYAYQFMGEMAVFFTVALLTAIFTTMQSEGVSGSPMSGEL